MRARGLRAGLAAGLVLAGCAGGFDPRPVDEVGFLARAQTQTGGGVRVTAAVPSARETRALFSTSLYRDGVQPVWLEIENRRDAMVAFLPVGLDPGYYTAHEAANLELEGDLDSSDPKRNQYFFGNSMNVWIGPRETRSGFVFTRLDEGTKAFNVDIAGSGHLVSFTFFVPVPGLKLDHHEVDWAHLYAPDEIVDLDENELIEAIARQPCCATDASGEGTADPLNLVIIGTPLEVYYAFLRAGWDETETVNRSSAIRTALSFLTGGEYRYSPVSSLYVFGRKQDVAFQKARNTIHERNHLRLWMSRARFQGKPVWIGQISRDIGVRFNLPTITTHKIDPDIDEAREYLLENLGYAQSLAKFGYAEGALEATRDAPRHNLTGDPYFTDGYRLVLFVSSTPVDLGDIELLGWSLPPDRRRRGAQPVAGP